MKKIIALILAAVTIMSMAVPALATGIDLGTKETPVIYDPENEAMIQQKQNQSLALPAASIYSTSVTVYPQIVGYYCGPATAYSVLKAKNVSVSSTTATLPFFGGCPQNCPYPGISHTCQKSYTSPQITLAQSMGMTTVGADFIMMKRVINNRLPSPFYAYTSIPNTAAGETILLNNITTTIGAADNPAIAWVDASKLDRYKGAPYGGHYVCLYSYNTDTRKVGIADPNYDTAYRGKYTEDATTLRKAMYRSSGAANLLY